MPLKIFGFQALWSPYFLAFILLMTAGYFLLTVKLRHKFSNSEPLKVKQAVLFVVSMVLIYTIKGSPVDLMAHIMFTFHMVQMAFLYIVIPPLFIAGIPNWVWRAVVELPAVQPAFRFFTKPLIALVLFNGLFSVYHIPTVMDYVKLNGLLHAAYTVALFVFAVFVWWPLVNKLEGHYQLSGLKKLGYIIADGVLLTPACALIIFAGHPMYETYTNGDMWMKAMELCVPANTLEGLTISGPEVFTDVPAVEDQQLGGVLMKIIQEIVLGVVLAQIFFEWYRREQQEGEAINAAALANSHANPAE